MSKTSRTFLLTTTPLAILAACSSDTASTDTGSVQIIVVAEESIPEGIAAGSSLEEIQDGWSVHYDRFLVTLGNLRASRSQSSSEVRFDPAVYVLDLKNAPSEGYLLATWTDMQAAEWDKFSFELPRASASSRAIAPTSDGDAAFMKDNGYSLYIEGAVKKEGGAGGPATAFKWGFQVATSFADCADEQGKAGFAVPASGTVQIKPTIHGDHWFFTNVTEGAEITERRAAWVDACNEDKDAELTIAELKTCKAADVFPSPIYNLTGMSDQDGDGVLSAFDYVASQVGTLGDFQGDGECPTRKRL